MTIQTLEVWCRDSVTDGVTGTENRREILSEESLNGWVRLGTVSTQQLNSLLYLLTSHSSPEPFSPYLHYASKTINADVAVEWVDGGSISETETPELYAYYGSTFPSLGSAPSGFTYVVRKQ